VRYAVAVVELDQGTLLLSNILDIDSHRIRCDTDVVVKFEDPLARRFATKVFTLRGANVSRIAAPSNSACDISAVTAHAWSGTVLAGRPRLGSTWERM